MHNRVVFKKKATNHIVIEQTKLDLNVIGKESGEVLGRPILSTVSDKHSRAILGYALCIPSQSIKSVDG